MNNYSDINLSVIVVSYNSNQILDDCLRTINEHTSEISYEIIVVDNNTINAKVEDVTSKYSNVVLIKNDDNLGFAAANNQGMRIAKGKYVLLLNNDTLLFENTLKKVYDFAETADDCAVIGCRVLNPDGTLQESVFDFDNLINIFGESFFLYRIFKSSPKLNRYHINYLNPVSACQVDWVKGCFIFVRRELALKYGGLDERFFFFGEETDFCYRIKKDGGKVYFLPETSIIHIDGAATRKVPWFKYRNQSIAKIKFYQKHFRGPKFIIAVGIHFSGIAFRVFFYFLQGLLTVNTELLLKSFYYLRMFFVYSKNVFRNQ